MSLIIIPLNRNKSNCSTLKFQCIKIESSESSFIGKTHILNIYHCFPFAVAVAFLICQNFEKEKNVAEFQQWLTVSLGNIVASMWFYVNQKHFLHCLAKVRQVLNVNVQIIFFSKLPNIWLLGYLRKSLLRENAVKPSIA